MEFHPVSRRIQQALVSALIYGDASGITRREERALDSFVAAVQFEYGRDGHWEIVDGTEEEIGDCDATGASGCETVEAIYQVPHIERLTLFGTVFERFHTGGGNWALRAVCDDGAHILITDDNLNLPTATRWQLGCYDVEGDPICGFVSSRGGV